MRIATAMARLPRGRKSPPSKLNGVQPLEQRSCYLIAADKDLTRRRNPLAKASHSAGEFHTAMISEAMPVVTLIGK